MSPLAVENNLTIIRSIFGKKKNTLVPQTKKNLSYYNKYLRKVADT